MAPKVGYEISNKPPGSHHVIEAEVPIQDLVQDVGPDPEKDSWTHSSHFLSINSFVAESC